MGVQSWDHIMPDDLRDLFAVPAAAAPKQEPKQANSKAPEMPREPKETKKSVVKRPKKSRSCHSQSSSDSGVRYCADIEPEPYDATLGEFTTLADLASRKTAKTVNDDSDSDAASSVHDSRVDDDLDDEVDVLEDDDGCEEAEDNNEAGAEDDAQSVQSVKSGSSRGSKLPKTTRAQLVALKKSAQRAKRRPTMVVLQQEEY